MIRESEDDESEETDLNSELFMTIKSTNSADEIVRRIIDLVESGASINAKDEFGCTLLHYACKIGTRNLKLVEYLTEKGAFVSELCENAMTPICFMYSYNNIEEDKKILTTLLSKGAHIDEGSTLGVSAIQMHFKSFFVKEWVEFLMELGTKIEVLDNGGNNLLHYACRVISVTACDAISYLIDCGIDSHAKNFVGVSPIEMKTGYLYYKHLKQSCEDCTAVAPLDELVSDEELCSVELLPSPITLKSTDEDHTEALFSFVRDGDSDMVRFLVEKCFPNINAKNKDGNTPLLIECKKEDPDFGIIQFLVHNGANINDHFRGCSSLQWVINRAYRSDLAVEICEYLLRKGFDVNTEDYAKNTLLHLACNKPYLNFNLIEILVQNMAKVDVQNVLGQTPIVLAASCGEASKNTLKVLKYLNTNTTCKFVDGVIISLEQQELEIESEKRTHMERYLKDLEELSMIYDDHVSADVDIVCGSREEILGNSGLMVGEE